MAPTSNTDANIENTGELNSKIATQKPQSYKTLIVLFGIFLFLSIVFGILLYMFPNTTPKNTGTDLDITPQTTNTSLPEATKEAVWAKFEGKYITGEITDGWEIIESDDWKDPPVEGQNYNGLFSLIISYKGITIFSFAAADGVGDPGICRNIYIFKDTKDTFVNERNEHNTQMGGEKGTVVDLSDKKYEEYEILGTKARRVENKIYFRLDNDTDHFNPACALESVLRPFDIYFKNGNEKMYTYFVPEEIPGNLSEKEFQQLDHILWSLKAE